VAVAEPGQILYRDDVYDPAKTIPLVDELLEGEKVFALWVVGTPNGLKLYDKINQRCVPNALLIGRSPAWGDPVNHPWTTGSLLSYGTEATLWMAFIDRSRTCRSGTRRSRAGRSRAT
jgi:branched-chain amino acid transport system substrate-binding protein